MANKEKQAENKEKIGIGAWLALIVLILVLSGAFRTAEGPIKVLDFTNLAGSFGQIGDTGANLIGKGGTGAKDGFMAGFNLIPAVMFFCGLLGVFEQLGAFKASDILFVPCSVRCSASRASAASHSSRVLPVRTLRPS